MKKIIAWILTAVLLLSLCACGGKNTQAGETKDQTDTQSVQSGNEQNGSEQNKDDDETQRLSVDAVQNAPETDADEFDYDVTDDGVEITNYNGDGGIVVVPEKIEGVDVVLIGEDAFANVDTVTAVKLPDTVREVGEKAFLNCTALEIFISGAGVKTLGPYAFNACVSLKKAILNDGLELIDMVCFGGVLDAEVEIPASVTQIVSAFLGESAEKPVTIIGEAGSYAEQYVNENGENCHLVFKAK